jgi:hypothetical protein
LRGRVDEGQSHRTARRRGAQRGGSRQRRALLPDLPVRPRQRADRQREHEGHDNRDADQYLLEHAVNTRPFRWHLELARPGIGCQQRDTWYSTRASE